MSKKDVPLQSKKCRNKYVFLRQNLNENLMQSIDDKIIAKIKKCGRGKGYFVSDFARYGEAKSVQKALERLVKSQTLLRLARGIYYYPKIDKELGLGVLYPSWEDIAYAIAKRDKARIVPTGLYALNRLGFSTQVPMNFVFLTDGTPRRINTGRGKGILFKHTAPKNLAFHSEIVMLIVFALKEIGKDKVTQEQLERLKHILQEVPKNLVLQDVKLMPAWVKSLIMRFYE